MAKTLPLVVGITLLLAGMSSAANWQIEMVDQSGAGKHSSLKIDKEGNAHLAYVVSDDKNSLQYAFWDHATKRWFVMTLGAGASFPSLALDSKQHPHISYADYGTVPGCKLRYVYWDGAIWHKEFVPINSETVAYYTSIALDENDNPSFSFYEYDGPRGTEFRVRMRVVAWNGKFWEVTTVDGYNQSGKFNSIAIDAHGHKHLAYANVNPGAAGLRYGYWDGNSWTAQEIDGREQNNMGYVGLSAYIALDKEGDPHITYMNSTDKTVKYASKKNGRWQIQVVDQLFGVGYPDRNSLTVDDQGTPYVTYCDTGRGSLKIAHREGPTWVAETVDDKSAASTSSVQVYRGTIWISYADQANGGLKVARAAVTELRSARASNLSLGGKNVVQSGH